MERVMVYQVAEEAEKTVVEGKIPEEVRILESDMEKQFADIGTERRRHRSTCQNIC